MAAGLHAGVDNLAHAWADVSPQRPLPWVPPPSVDPNVPLGELLPEPERLEANLDGAAGVRVVPSPAALLEAPNDKMPLRWWPSTAPVRRGTVILVPPWQFRSFTLLRPMVRPLNLRGYDVVGYPTPYHFERTPEGSFSGELFATWDMPRTGLAIRTACLELCSLVESLQSRGPVSLLGVSLGGYLSAMTSVVAPLYPQRAFNISRMCLVVPPANILDVFLKTPIGARYRRLLARAGGTAPDEKHLHSLSMPFSPFRFRSAVPGERTLVAAARHDTVVPLESSQALADGFRAHLRVYEAGHVTGMLLTPALWRDVGNFLDDRFDDDAVDQRRAA